MSEEKRIVKVGSSSQLDKPMTKAQAFRYGEKEMPADLRKVGFKTVIFTSCADLHGGLWFRINYGK